MAADLDGPHILQILDHLPCNASELCCKSADNDSNNNINAQTAEEPCIPSKTKNLKQESTQRFQAIKCETKDASVCQGRAEADPSKNNNLPTSKISVSVSSTKSSVFEKWAAMDRASQRPQAKRQLSDTSKACTSQAVKKTMARQEEQKASLNAQQEKTGDQNFPYKSGSRWKLHNNEDFHRVDAHVINTGKQLKSQKVFSVQTIANTITEVACTDLERLRAIWIWLCHNIDYDVNGYLGLTEKESSPERVIETGRGVCCGYSSVCLQMCTEVGIECREVGGHGKGVGYRQGQHYQNTKPSHMWNVVCLDGHWYLLDACWGAGTVDLDKRTFIKRYNEFYFLTDPEDFINSHFPDEEEWQLLDCPIKLEEFEKWVLRTSEFFRLGLTLIHPKEFLLVTDDGEACISMGFSQPVDFAYHISQHSGGEHKDLSSSMGLLTVTSNTMKLRLIPPTTGTFDIMMFARPGNTTGTFRWVCSFRLECHAPKATDNLPENPYQYWGMNQNAKDLGLKPCMYASEAIVLQAGSFELVLQTARPLMMLCELSHKDLDKNLARRCVVTQIEADKLTCNILCAYTGYYRLSVFVRDYQTAKNSFQNAANFLLHCIANPINLNELYPSDLNTFCGPGISTDEAGLSKFSHTGAIVSTQQGKCNVTFQNQQDLDFHALLDKEHRKQSGFPLSQHVFFTYNGTKVTVSLALPEAGIYKLSLYSKSPSSQEFRSLCDFIIQNSSESSWPPFPFTYTDWRKGSVLFEPRSGLLEPQCWVQFRVRVPDAHRVCVQGEQRVNLQLNKSHIWEGDVFTGNVEQLHLAASQEKKPNEMAILMSFDVLKQQIEM